MYLFEAIRLDESIRTGSLIRIIRIFVHGNYNRIGKTVA